LTDDIASAGRATLAAALSSTYWRKRQSKLGELRMAGRMPLDSDARKTRPAIMAWSLSSAGQDMTEKASDDKRYQRYQQVVTAALAADSFALSDVKDACAEEYPGLVTRIVGELEKDGLLERGGTKSRPTFRWIRDRQEFSPRNWTDSKIYCDRITQAPKSERPRERLLANGAASLKTAELLAILVRKGRRGQSALQIGEMIAARYADRLEQLAHAGRGELAALSSAVGEAAYCQIMAGIELGRRVAEVADRRRREPGRITSTAEAMEHCRTAFARLADDGAQEEFHIVTLDTKNQVVGSHQISVGLLDQSMVHPREVFRAAIRDAAKSIILVHNHPSGDPAPSGQDVRLSRRLEQVGETVGIEVLDHIIVARRGATSLREFEAE
jgi:DNA repair protein RadC